MKRNALIVLASFIIFGASHSSAQAPNPSPTPPDVPKETPTDAVAPTPYATPAPTLKMPANANSADPAAAIRSLKAALIRSQAVAQQAQHDVEAILQNNNLRATIDDLEERSSRYAKEIMELKGNAEAHANALSEARTALTSHAARAARLEREMTDMAASAVTRNYIIMALVALCLLTIILFILARKRCSRLEEGSDIAPSDGLLEQARTRHTETLRAAGERHELEL
jgi:hypothetical protein